MTRAEVLVGRDLDLEQARALEPSSFVHSVMPLVAVCPEATPCAKAPRAALGRPGAHREAQLPVSSDDARDRGAGAGPRLRLVIAAPGSRR